MAMDRRDFMKLCSVAGLGVVATGMSGIPEADAQAAQLSARKCLFVNMSGGFEMTWSFDPKGDIVNSEGYSINNPMTAYPTSDIVKVGGINYPAHTAGNDLGANRLLFEGSHNLHQYMTMIRGIDTETNGHDGGQRNMWSGRLPDNSPAFLAVYAAAIAGTLPMAFITNGGYDSTFGVPVSKTRFGNANALYPLIYPNLEFPSPGQIDGDTIHSPETFARIQELRLARLDTMQAQQGLKLIKKQQSLLYNSRLGMDELKKIDEYLQLIENNVPGGLGGPNNNNMVRQGHIALAAFKAGLSVAATMSRGGFDTHGQTDQNVANPFLDVADAVTTVFATAVDLLELGSELLMVIGSEFSRTPRYNEGAGKDHWAVNSVCVIDPLGEIPGSRVIGASDDVLRPIALNGTVVKYGHIHKWMRSILGIAETEVARLFPTQVEEFIDFTTAPATAV